MPRCEVAKNEMQSSLSLSLGPSKKWFCSHTRNLLATLVAIASSNSHLCPRTNAIPSDGQTLLYLTSGQCALPSSSSSSARSPPWKINRSDDCTAMHWCRLQYQECSVRLQTCSAAGQCNRFTCQNFIIAANLLVDSRLVCSPPPPPRTFWPEEDQLLKRKRLPIN